MLLGAALRIICIDAQPLSGDEAYSIVIWTQTSLDYLLKTIAVSVTEPHPPLALFLYHGWSNVAGDSVLSLRYFAALGGLVTMAAIYQIAHRLGGERAALIALGLAAISPFQVWYSQFARNYSLWMAGSALAALFLLHGWQHPTRIRRWLPYVVTSILTGYIFYLEILHWAAHNLYALTKLWKRWSLIPYWAITQIVIAAALAPWYLRPELFSNSQEYLPNGIRANPLYGLQSLVLGFTLPPFLQDPQAADPAHSLGPASIFVALLILISLIIVWKTASRDAFTFTSFTALVPITGLALLTVITGRKYFHPRYIAASAVSMTILIALAIDGIGKLPNLLPVARRFLPAGITAILIALSAIGLWSYQFDSAFLRGPEWSRIMDVLEAQTTPNDLVIYNFPDPAFDYYFTHEYRGGAASVVVPTKALESYEAVTTEIEKAGVHDTIWFIPVSARWWDRDENVARWLDEHKQYVSDQWIGVTHLYQYSDWEVSVDEVTNTVNKDFDSVGQLVSFRLTPPLNSLRPGDTGHFELFWQPTHQTTTDLKVFVHLRGSAKPDGSIVWAQDDHLPQNGRISTRTWEVGSLLRDVYTLSLPPDMPSGDYAIFVGLYNPATGERIHLLNTEDGDDPDAALLFHLTIRH
jgi:hypothetical protein